MLRRIGAPKLHVGCFRLQSTLAPLTIAGALPSSPAVVMAPIVGLSKGMHSDPLSRALSLVGWGLFGTTYLIMVNWIYTGYLELWDGVYGVDDDEDDE